MRLCVVARNCVGEWERVCFLLKVNAVMRGEASSWDLKVFLARCRARMRPVHNQVGAVVGAYELSCQLTELSSNWC